MHRCSSTGRGRGGGGRRYKGTWEWQLTTDEPGFKRRPGSLEAIRCHESAGRERQAPSERSFPPQQEHASDRQRAQRGGAEGGDARQPSGPRTTFVGYRGYPLHPTCTAQNQPCAHQPRGSLSRRVSLPPRAQTRASTASIVCDTTCTWVYGELGRARPGEGEACGPPSPGRTPIRQFSPAFRV
jgi:hypothetical protein